MGKDELTRLRGALLRALFPIRPSHSLRVSQDLSVLHGLRIQRTEAPLLPQRFDHHCALPAPPRPMGRRPAPELGLGNGDHRQGESSFRAGKENSPLSLTAERADSFLEPCACRDSCRPENRSVGSSKSAHERIPLHGTKRIGTCACAHVARLLQESERFSRL